MDEGVVEEGERALKPANENPWYVLMTLYGNPSGPNDTFNWALQRKNAVSWNLWIGRAVTSRQRRLLSDIKHETDIPNRLSAKKRSEIRAAFEKRYLEPSSAEGVVPPIPDPHDPVDLSFLILDQHLSTNGMIFPSGLNAARTRFLKGFSLSGVFFATCDFEVSKFEGPTSFSELWAFHGVNLIDATFFDNFFFDAVEIEGSLNTHGCTFEGLADFSGSGLIGRTLFHDTKFLGAAEFNEVDFGEVTFANSVFSAPTYFHRSRFRTHYPDLSGTTFKSSVSFSSDAENWPARLEGDPAQAKASCATIRHNLGKQGLPEAEHFFFRREMGFAGQSGPLWQRPPYWLFGWLLDYGYSILTPLLWLGLLIVGGASVLAWGTAGSQQALDFWHGLGLSFSNAFNFLGFHKTFQTEDLMGKLPPLMKAFSGFQTIGGVILLFFVGLGLRTRFRLR